MVNKPSADLANAAGALSQVADFLSSAATALVELENDISQHDSRLAALEASDLKNKAFRKELLDLLQRYLD